VNVCSTVASSRRKDLASFCTLVGHVAENNSVWRALVGGSFPMMTAIWGWKPMSSMRSASSITESAGGGHYSVFGIRSSHVPNSFACRRARQAGDWESKSTRRPGVATTTCGWVFSSAFCSAIGAPP
jgi:hypothetical protein